ncbi:MAG: LytTR family DNA-binding domain-containing protein [Clostridiales bacterium]|nr:LytTR family DNA-binding domain-containing protein [Clostridiales bacterium]
MLNILIVDDEKHIREELNYLLSKYEDINICAEVATGKKALEITKRMKIDAVFLDIRLQNTNGMMIARKLLEINEEILIVLATAHQEYAIQSYEIDIFDYILKPFSEGRIKKTVERIREKIKKEVRSTNESEGQNVQKDVANRICVENNGKIKLLDVKNVKLFEYRNNKTEIHANKEVYYINTTLKSLEEQLPSENFIRTHRAYIVNIDYIDEIIPWFNYTYKLSIKDMDSEIPVSRNYMKKFKERVNLYI